LQIIPNSLNAGNIDNVAGLDELVVELNEKVPGVMNLTDVSNPSDVVDDFFRVRDNLQSQVDQVYDAARSQMSNQALLGTQASVPANVKDDITDRLFSKFNLSRDEIIKSPALSRKVDTVAQKIAGTKGDPVKLFDVVSNLTTDKGLLADVATADRNKIIEAARQYARDQLVDIIPGADDYFKNQSALWETINSSAGYLNELDKVPLPLVGGQVGVPGAGKAKQEGTNLLANIVGGTGRGLEGLGNVANRANVSQFAQNPRLAQALGIAAGAEGVEGTPGINQFDEYDTEGETITRSSGFTSDDLALFDQLVTPTKLGGMGMTPGQAKEYISTITGRGMDDPKLLESQRKFYGAAEQARKALDMLEKGEAQTGKLQAVSSSIGKVTGSQSAKQAEYELAITAAASPARNAIAGSALTDSEKELLRPLIPTITDEPVQAKAKLEAFIDAMQSYANPQT
jgi:hypothetical protein